MIDACELRDLIREYGAMDNVDDETYEALYDFGIWYADKVNARDAILSDRTPLASSQLTT